MPAANWKSRREALIADARRGKPVIPQPAPDEAADPWFVFATVVVLMLSISGGIIVMLAVRSGGL